MSECRYCGTLNDYLLVYEYGDIATFFVEVSGDAIRCFNNDFRHPSIESIKINFCPMCGRKL